MKINDKNKKIFLVILLFASLWLNLFVIDNVISKVNSPEVYDFLFSILPSSNLYGFLAWGAIINILVCVFAVIQYPKKGWLTVKLVTALYFVRAFFISITVLGVPAERTIPDMNSFLLNISYTGNDFFFSGHVAFPFLLALIFWEEKKFRYCFLFMSFVFAFGSIIARTHYSIDVFAAPFVAYTIYALGEKYFKY